MRWDFLHLFVRFRQQSINPLALGGRQAGVVGKLIVFVVSPGHLQRACPSSEQADQALPGPEMASPVFTAKRKGHVDPTMVSLSKFKTKQMVPSTGRSSMKALKRPHVAEKKTVIPS